MKQERVEELLKAARERLNGPPGSRGITMLPDEVLEVLEGNLVVETTQDIPESKPKTLAASGGPWDAVGRIAAAYIAKQPPNLKADRVATYVTDVLQDVRSKASLT